MKATCVVDRRLILLEATYMAENKHTMNFQTIDLQVFATAKRPTNAASALQQPTLYKVARTE